MLSPDLIILVMMVVVLWVMLVLMLMVVEVIWVMLVVMVVVAVLVMMLAKDFGPALDKNLLVLVAVCLDHHQCLNGSN